MSERINGVDVSLDCESCAENKSGSYRDQKKKITDGLRRVEGQLRGIQRMVAEERYCVDVLNQLTASRMALARISLLILTDHVRGCVKKSLAENGAGEGAIDELIEVIKKFLS